jgi:hypothetical protein
MITTSPGTPQQHPHRLAKPVSAEPVEEFRNGNDIPVEKQDLAIYGLVRKRFRPVEFRVQPPAYASNGIEVLCVLNLESASHGCPGQLVE